MDAEIVEHILHEVPGARFEFEGDRCVLADLTDPSSIFHGLIRHHPRKAQILKLISALRHLHHLDLRKNLTGPLPDAFADLPLRHLDLGSNALNGVPWWVTRTVDLEFLNLGVNGLDTVPDFSGLSRLKVLKLHKNPIGSLNGVPGSLEFLNLYLNRMPEIPAQVLALRNLKFFSWGASRIEAIPDGISQWSSLEWLSVVSNEIATLPVWLFDLPLWGLRLHKNKIEALPDEVGRSKLKQLALYHNRLTALPRSLAGLGLDKLSVGKNPLPPSELDFARSVSRWCLV